MLKVLLIAAGGSAGALMRYGVSTWGQRLAPGDFPLGTLIVNTTGCILVGCLAAYAGAYQVREEYRLALSIGFLGAFTTFSTFSNETLTLARSGQWTTAAVNVLITNVLALAGVCLGYYLTDRFTSA